MKSFNSLGGSLLLSIIFLITLCNPAKGQTSLGPGDIVFTGYHSATATIDSFSFVILKNISAGTQINFTDNGWLNPGPFSVGESHLTFTSIALPAGREITIGGSNARQASNGISAGTITYTAGPNPISLTTSGDQVLAYQGPVMSPVFISAIHMNLYATDVFECANTTAAVWDPNCWDGANGTIGGGSFSKLPPGMITGTNAIWIGTPGVAASEMDNGRFVNCGTDLSTPALVRAAVNNPANWQTSNTNPPGFNLPSGCTFLLLAPLPVKLLSFTVKLNSDKTTSLQWKVENQQDIQQYILEESNNASSFRPLSAFAAGNGTQASYSFNDMQVDIGMNYYRLKIVERSGLISYSEIIKTNLKEGLQFLLYPNPVIDKLTIQQFGSNPYKMAILVDAQGKILQQIKLTSLSQEVNIETYPAGFYMLKMGDGTVFSVIKK